MRLAISAVFLSLILALAGTAQAHRISVYAYLEDGQIKGEGYMPGGGKVSNQQVQLLDAGGKVLAETKTNPEGAFSLPLPQAKPPLTLVLNAGAGHRATYELKAADLGVAPASADATAGAQPDAPTTKPAAQAVAAPQDLAPQVKKAVEQAVAPLRAQLADMALHSNEASLKDIVGGLGWIVGLLGLAAYFKARKMTRAS